MPRRLSCWLILGCALSCSKSKTTETHPPKTSLENVANQVPPKPVHLQAQVQGQSIALRWDAIAGARKYHMQWAAEGRPEVLLGQASITTPGLTVHDLDHGRYVFYVALETPDGPGPMESITAIVRP